MTQDDDHNPDMVRHAELWAKYRAEGLSDDDARDKATETLHAVDALAVHFRFLDALRENGSINMFAAAAPLAEAFQLDRAAARRSHVAWMKTFGDGRSPAEERAAAALS